MEYDLRMLLQDPVSVMPVHDHAVPYDQGPEGKNNQKRKESIGILCRKLSIAAGF